MTLPAGWKSTTLSQFVDLQRGFDLPSQKRVPGQYKVLSSGKASGSHNEGPVKGPGFVIGRATNLGRPTWSDDDYWPLNTVLFVKDFRGNDPKFAYYLFESLDLSGYDSGSVQPMLNRNYIAKVEINIPKVDEQRQIARTLGALDDKIESNRRIVRLALESLDALSIRASAELPTVALGSLVVVTRDSLNPARLGDQRVAHFSLPAFDAGARPELVPASVIMSNKLAITQPTILVSRLNPRINRTWWATPTDDVQSIASTEFAPLTAGPAESLAAVWLAVRDEFFREELARRVTGTSGSHQRVRPEDMLAIEVPDVSKLANDVKTRALGFLELVQRKRHETATLEGLRDALLPELLSGRIRVPEAQEVMT